jgi:hypothetical protein
VGAHDFVAYCKRLGTENMWRALCKLAKDSILRTEAFGATQRCCMMPSAGFGAGCEVERAVCTFTLSPRRESTWPRAECAPSFRWPCAHRVEAFSSRSQESDRVTVARSFERSDRQSLTRGLGRLTSLACHSVQIHRRTPLSQRLPKIERSLVPLAPGIGED